jgi:hypothetical protein
MVLPPMIQRKETTPMKTESSLSGDISAFYQVVVNGDLKSLSHKQQAEYLVKLSESLGLNPMTRPFAFIELQGKMTVYALKECAAQLAKRDCVSVKLGEYRFNADQNFLEVTATAKDPSGRETDEVAAITFSTQLKGDGAANARMRLATKAKRRAILAHCGLGMLDESELDTVSNKKEPTHATTNNIMGTIPAEAFKPLESPATPTMDEGIFSTPDILPSAPVSNFDHLQQRVPTLDVLDFDYNNTEDREWLIATVKKHKPKADRTTIVTLAQTFAKHTTKAAIIADLKGNK